jgi:hypothetical protein
MDELIASELGLPLLAIQTHSIARQALNAYSFGRRRCMSSRVSEDMASVCSRIL